MAAPANTITIDDEETMNTPRNGSEKEDAQPAVAENEHAQLKAAEDAFAAQADENQQRDTAEPNSHETEEECMLREASETGFCTCGKMGL